MKKQQRLVMEMTERIRRSLNLKDILQSTVDEVRQFLKCDRVLIFQFSPSWSGTVVVESVGVDWTAILATNIYDPCFSEEYVEPFKKGLVTAKSDIYHAGISPCHIEFLESLQVRANLVVPVLLGDELWGLLVAHHCAALREWQSSEIDLLRQLGGQVSLAIQQADLFKQLETELIEREQIEAVLRQSERRYRALVLASSQIVWHTDAQGSTMAIPEGWEELTGQSPEESLKWGWLNLIHPDDRDRTTQSWQTSCTNPSLCEIEYRLRMKDGNYRDFISRGVPILDTDGKITEWIGTCTDITERKKAKAELEKRVAERTVELKEVNDRLLEAFTEQHQARQLLQEQAQLLDLAHDTIITRNLKGSICSWNQGAEYMYGWTKAEALGQISHTLLKTQFSQPLTEIEAELLEKGYWEGELIHYTRDSRPINLASRWVLQKDDAGRPIKVLEINNDITERKQAEQALQQQTERERMVSAIAQNIHQSLNLHDILNTTVTEVRHFLQTDRVIIYRFNPDWSGVVITESVAEGWLPILNMEITDNYFVKNQGLVYQQGIVRAIPDICTEGFSECHLQLLASLQVRAKMILPILHGGCLWGLLVAHNCSDSRQWYPWEIELLKQLAIQLAIAIQQSELYQQLQQANQQLENLAMVDQLTQIANRRCFDHKLDYTWQHLLREQGSLSLLLCDIDYFKQYNDTYGHAAGDTCLTLVAQALKETIKRSTDLAARYGGEEFVVILPNTDRDGAAQIAQDIQEAIQKLNIPHITSAVKPFITLSIGIATVIPISDLVPIDLIEAADQALYQAKAQGRNRSLGTNSFCSCSGKQN